MSKLIFPFASSREHYRNKVAFLWCSDQRFEDLREAFKKANDLEMPDPIIIPGGAKVLADPKDPRDRDFVLEQIELLRGHGFDKLCIMVHNECAACAGVADEPEFYEKMLREAAKVIRERIPDLKVVLLFADFDGLHEIEQ